MQTYLKAFTYAYSWFFGISQILLSDKELATVDVLVVWFVNSWSPRGFHLIQFIQAWASALSFYRIRQCESLKEREGQQYRLSRLLFYNKTPTRRGRRLFTIMSFGKGRTNCQVERDIFYESFKDSISILIKSQKEEETYIKAILYDISASQYLSKEEKVSESRTYEQLLADIEEKYIRIRRTVFIGIYSYWEISLKELQDIKKEKHIKNKPNLKKCSSSKK